MKTKKALLVVAALAGAFLPGCWGTFHTAFVHISEVTQLWAALNQLGLA